MIPFAENIGVKTSCAVGYFDKGDFFYVRFKKTGTPIELPEYKEFMEGCQSLIGERKVLNIVDLRGQYVYFSKEARAYTASNEQLNNMRIAEAILVDNVAIRIAAQFYLSLFKPPVKTKLFSDLMDAKKWLQQQKEEYNQGSSIQKASVDHLMQ
jgi:hypothetical protein